MASTKDVPDLNPDTGTITCVANSKQAQRRCQKLPTPGARVCYMHGSKSLVGIANPAFKDGRKSKYMPTRMLDDLVAASSDPDLHSLREEITIIDARISDLIKRVDTGESGHLWKLLSEAQREVDRLERAGANYAEELTFARNEVRSLIIDGHDDYVAWQEVMDAIDRRKKLLESERKRMIEMKKSVDTDRVLALFGALMNVVKNRVDDRETLSHIARDAARLINAPEYGS